MMLAPVRQVRMESRSLSIGSHLQHHRASLTGSAIHARRGIPPAMIILAACFIAGCSLLPSGATSVPLNPAKVRIEQGEHGPRLEAVGDQNSSKGLTAEIHPDGTASVTTTGSTPVKIDAALAAMSQPTTIAGIGLVILGIGLFVASKHPATAAFIPSGAGFWAIGGGIGLIALPLLLDRLLNPWLVCGGVIAGFIIYSIKVGGTAKWFQIATSPDEQAKLLAAGDRRAAGALRYLNTRGNRTEAKVIANPEVKS